VALLLLLPPFLPPLLLRMFLLPPPLLPVLLRRLLPLATATAVAAIVPHAFVVGGVWTQAFRDKMLLTCSEPHYLGCNVV